MRFDYINYCKHYFTSNFNNNMHLVIDFFEGKEFSIKIIEVQLVNRHIYFIDYETNFVEELQFFIAYYIFYYLKFFSKCEFTEDKLVFIFYTKDERKLPYFDITSKALPFDIHDWNQLSSSKNFKFYFSHLRNFDDITDLEIIKQHMDLYL